MTYADPEKRRAACRRRLRVMREKAGGAAAFNKRWESANPEKAKAHKIVENNLRSGRVKKQPCQVCGVTKLVHAHHEDYSKPLQIMWLCPLHHRHRHAELALGVTEPDLPDCRDFGPGLSFTHCDSPHTNGRCLIPQCADNQPRKSCMQKFPINRRSPPNAIARDA